jgi:RNase H-like domain found in reverse transcriptase
MAAVLLQAEPSSSEAKHSEEQEASKTGPCNFDKHMHHMRLRPIAFSSRKCTDAEGNMHSFTGEAATGVWAIEKYKRHIFGREFTWMTDCNGLRQFFEGEDVPTHIHQRMRQRLLRYMFTIVHRPARFMIECDVLTRYNNLTNLWRPTQEQTATPIAIANQPIEFTASTKPRTLLAEISDGTRIIWAFNAGSTNIGTATESVGINAEIARIEERPQWRTKAFDKEHDDPKLTTIDQLETEMEEDETTDWIIAHDGSDEYCQAEREEQYQQLTKLIAIGERHKARAAIIFTSPTTDVDRRIEQLETSCWTTLRAKVQANRYGATVATRYTMIVATKCIHTLCTFHMEGREATPLADILDPETEPTNPSIHMDSYIMAMQREANQKPRNHNEPRVAAIIQQKGQATNNTSWVTAWTPCYDTEHPDQTYRTSHTNGMIARPRSKPQTGTIQAQFAESGNTNSSNSADSTKTHATECTNNYQSWQSHKSETHHRSNSWRQQYKDYTKQS